MQLILFVDRRLGYRALCRQKDTLSTVAGSNALEVTDLWFLRGVLQHAGRSLFGKENINSGLDRLGTI